MAFVGSQGGDSGPVFRDREAGMYGGHSLSPRSCTPEHSRNDRSPLTLLMYTGTQPRLTRSTPPPSTSIGTTSSDPTLAVPLTALSRQHATTLLQAMVRQLMMRARDDSTPGNGVTDGRLQQQPPQVLEYSSS